MLCLLIQISNLISLQTQTKALGLPDPLTPLQINGQEFSRFVFLTSKGMTTHSKQILPKQSVELFTQLLKLHQADSELDIQMLPTSILWGRKPNQEGKEKPYLEAMSACQKSRLLVSSGRDCMIRFSPVVSLRYMADTHGVDETIAHKLARVARIHFSRQKLAASGPSLPQRQVLFNRLLKSPENPTSHSR